MSQELSRADLDRPPGTQIERCKRQKQKRGKHQTANCLALSSCRRSTHVYRQNRPLPPLSPSLHSFPILPQDAQAYSYLFLRGPRYKAYSELRESRLLKKYKERCRMGEEIGPVPTVASPPRKQVKFHDLATTQDWNLMKDVKVPSFVESGRVRGRKVSSVVAESVPDFSAALRKENRRPSPETSLTPPPVKKGNAGMGNGLSAKGSKSASATEKRGGGVAARKSYASLKELRGSSFRAGERHLWRPWGKPEENYV